MQLDYLQRMGIQVWKQRQACRGFSYKLGDSGWLLAEVSNQAPKSEQHLVEQILSAMKLSYEGGLQQELTLPPNGKVLVCLGEVFSTLVLGTSLKAHVCQPFQKTQVMVTHSLSAMLSDAALKRQVWSDLKAVLRVLNEAGAL